ncbi:50S ribosomal protein L22 [Candidatus Peregrinibacteria bacterium]|nr:MAG: 50S ribosomal protein L22 [Candidatus Peregrinibacteria bacterium]
MKAILRNIRISPKKANVVAGLVRGKSVNTALETLQFTPKKGADILYKVVHSAASNAKHNFKQSFEELEVTKVIVTKGPTLKRSLPVSRGRAHPIRKRTAHITVEVGAPTAEKEVKKPTKRTRAPKKAVAKNAAK